MSKEGPPLLASRVGHSDRMEGYIIKWGGNNEEPFREGGVKGSHLIQGPHRWKTHLIWERRRRITSGVSQSGQGGKVDSRAEHIRTYRENFQRLVFKTHDKWL